VVATPGHTADHLAFRLDSGAVLVGDHVLGRGTSVVTHPEGDVVAYLESLRRVHDLGPSALYCGHGPALTEDPGAVLDYYLAHRAFREAQLIAALADGPQTVDELVARIYAEVPREVWPAAAQSTRATLAKLSAEGRVAPAPGGRVRTA
jgi:glyoxylase-like metal-dependent hydrolase (beta-lactamase superfamily II)